MRAPGIGKIVFPLPGQPGKLLHISSVRPIGQIMQVAPDAGCQPEAVREGAHCRSIVRTRRIGGLYTTQAAGRQVAHNRFQSTAGPAVPSRVGKHEDSTLRAECGADVRKRRISRIPARTARGTDGCSGLRDRSPESGGVGEGVALHRLKRWDGQWMDDPRVDEAGLRIPQASRRQAGLSRHVPHPIAVGLADPVQHRGHGGVVPRPFRNVGKIAENVHLRHAERGHGAAHLETGHDANASQTAGCGKAGIYVGNRVVIGYGKHSNTGPLGRRDALLRRPASIGGKPGMRVQIHQTAKGLIAGLGNG